MQPLSLRFALTVLTAMLAAATPPAWAQQPPDPKYKATVPPSITTPDTVQTRIGTLKFSDGRPDDETVKKAYDQLDFGRGVEAFMAGMPAASVYAICKGLDEAGVKPNQGVGVTDELGDARTLLLTLNTATVYAWFCIDLKDGPVVVEIPPGILGFVDDAAYRFLTDVGFVGRDQGKGGKYLFVGPDYQGAIPQDGYFVSQSPTYSNYIMYRSFVENGDIAAAARNIRAGARVYPLSAAANPPKQVLVNLTGLQVNTIHANDFHFYEELNAVVQYEPENWVEPEKVGHFAAIGIKKGTPFAPDARMKAILVDAVAVGNAASRAILFASRDPRTKIYPDRQWYTSFFTGSSEFADRGERGLDARTMFHYYATGITPAMVPSKPGVGSSYMIGSRDAEGRYLDGSKTYKVTLPASIPAARFWSINLYDNQTRSLLETDQKLAGIDSTLPERIKKNADGSVTVWFGPKAPGGQEGNWVQTWPGKGWNAIFRLYGPLQGWFDKSWKPGDFELVE